MEPSLLRARIAAARRELALAEEELQTAGQALAQGIRADKTMVTAAMEGALVKVRRARTELAELEGALEG